jgi:hypothetical protein
MSDAGLIPDPEEMVAGFRVEFGELLALARQRAEVPSLQELTARVEALSLRVEQLLERRDRRLA